MNGVALEALTEALAMPLDINMLPTPLTRDYKGGTTAIRKDTGKIRTDALDSCVKYMAENGLLPTPITSDSQGGARKIGENGRTLRKSSGENFSASLKDTVVGAAAAAGISSRLNPLFTEEMMGFPFLWTALPFLGSNGTQETQTENEETFLSGEQKP
jgi:hypothetical protein